VSDKWKMVRLRAGLEGKVRAHVGPSGSVAGFLDAAVKSALAAVAPGQTTVRVSVSDELLRATGDAKAAVIELVINATREALA
jgi:hypothetical protein